MTLQRAIRAKSLFDVIPYRIARLNAEMVKVLTAFCEANGLSFQQWRVLSLIGNFGSIAATEICKWTTNDKALVSRVISQLDASGLIERRADVDDGRRLLVLLTPAGEEVYARIGGLMDANENRILGGMSAGEIDSLLAVLHRLEDRTKDVLAELELEREGTRRRTQRRSRAG